MAGRHSRAQGAIVRDDTTNPIVFMGLVIDEVADIPREYLNNPSRRYRMRLRQEWEAEKRRRERPVRTTLEYRRVKALRHAAKKSRKVNHRKLRRRL